MKVLLSFLFICCLQGIHAREYVFYQVLVEDQQALMPLQRDVLPSLQKANATIEQYIRVGKDEQGRYILNRTYPVTCENQKKVIEDAGVMVTVQEDGDAVEVFYSVVNLVQWQYAMDSEHLSEGQVRLTTAEPLRLLPIFERVEILTKFTFNEEGIYVFGGLVKPEGAQLIICQRVD